MPVTATRVSIILPTYNRAAFLDEAFQSIRQQTLADWELIVVDDGSTDNTRAMVEELAASVSQPVRYIYQENQGAYGARNTGLDHVQSPYVAFYDSDDLWLPHHLADCVAALEAHPEVDWVYGGGKIVDLSTGRTLAEQTFYQAGRPRPFLKLAARRHGTLHIIEDDRAICCQILSGLYCGFQTSVLRATVFADGTRFDAVARNEAEDQLFAIKALAAGHRLAYLDQMHLIYRVHDANSSGASQGNSLAKRVELIEKMIAGYEQLPQRITLNRSERRALRKRLGGDYFWTLGYALLWEGGRRQEALAKFHRGLSYYPWSMACWKTYLLARIRILWRRATTGDETQEVSRTHA